MSESLNRRQFLGATAAGASAIAGGLFGLAAGHAANSGTGADNTATGALASTVGGASATANGKAAQAEGTNSSAFGAGANANVDNGLALANTAAVLAAGGIAAGVSARVLATHTNAIALGKGSLTTAAQRTTLGVVGGSASQLQELQVSAGLAEFGATPPSSQPSAISDVPTGGSATAAANATAINAILAVIRTRGTIAT